MEVEPGRDTARVCGEDGGCLCGLTSVYPEAASPFRGKTSYRVGGLSKPGMGARHQGMLQGGAGGVPSTDPLERPGGFCSLPTGRTVEAEKLWLYSAALGICLRLVYELLSSYSKILDQSHRRLEAGGRGPPSREGLAGLEALGSMWSFPLSPGS